MMSAYSFEYHFILKISRSTLFLKYIISKQLFSRAGMRYLYIFWKIDI